MQKDDFERLGMIIPEDICGKRLEEL